MTIPTAYVEVHPDDADALNIRSGDIVTLESRRGAVDLPVWLNGRGAPPPGSLFVPFFDETRLVNSLTTEAHDPFSLQPDFKKCAAQIRVKQ